MSMRTQLKQPREGVVGVDRSGDDLLSLDERAVAHRDALIVMARHLHRACLVGDPAPIVREMYDRITNPRVGDLVVEATCGVWTRNLDLRLKGFGYLVKKREEWWETDAEWERMKAEDDLTDDDRRTDEAWYIQYGPDPGDICRWTDCDFYAVPIDPQEFR